MLRCLRCPADGGPTVTIGTIAGNRVADTGATPPTPGITVEVTYSVPVTISDVTVADLLHTVQDAAGNTVGTAGSNAGSVATIPATLPAPAPTEHDKFLFTLPDVTDNTARKVVVWVPADGVSGLTPGGTAGPLNQASAFVTHTLPSVLSFTAALTATQKKDASDMDIAGRFTVTLTVKKADNSAPTDSEVTPAPTVADITVMPMGAATAVDASGAAVAATTALAVGTADDGIYTQDYQLGFGFAGSESVTFQLGAGYMANSPTLKLPPAEPKDPVYQNPPTITLTVTEHDAAEMSFRVDVSTTPADDTDGMAGKAITGAAIKAALSVKDGSTPAIDVGVSLLDGDDSNERLGDNSYRAFLEYGVFDTLPLTVSIDPNDLDDNPNAADVDAVTATVGEGGDTPPPTNAPAKPAAPTAVTNATNDLSIDVSWTAPDDKRFCDHWVYGEEV